MRIVMLSTGHPVYDSYPNGGGIQYEIAGVATELSRAGHDIHIVCRHADVIAASGSSATFHQVNPPALDQIVSTLHFSKQAMDLINSLKPEVIAAYDKFSAYFPSRSRFPLIFTAHNPDAFRYYRDLAIQYNPLNVFVHPWKRHLEEHVMKRAAQVVALTASAKGYLESVGIRNVQIIPDGVRSADYHDLGDEEYILYVGRLDAPKRVEDLIAAFASMTDLRRDFRLVLVGDGPNRRQLMALAKNLGVSERVRFVGWVVRERLTEYFARCSVLVLPSEFETFGIVLLEAMASSKPVVASRIPGPADIVEDGVDGLLFGPKDPADLRKKLMRVLADRQLRRDLGRAASEKIRNSYDFSRISVLYERVLLAASRRPAT